jgi:plastocyanin
VPTVAHRLRVAALALAVSALPACGTSKDNDNARALLIQDFFFVPSPLRAVAGEKVAVVNLDSVSHTLTADDGSVAIGPIGAGEQASFTVDRPGVTAFHCEIHNYMRGVLRVRAAPANS